MTVIMPIFLNEKRIGSITVSRRSRVPEEVNDYDWHVMLEPHDGYPGEDINNDPDEPVEHYRDDGVLVLLTKVLEKCGVDA